MYIIAYIDENKLDYGAINDNYFNILKSIVNWKTIAEYFEGVGINSSAHCSIAMMFFVVYSLILGRYRTSKVNIFAWAALYAKVSFYSRIVRMIAFFAVIFPNNRPDCFATKFIMP